MSSKGNSLILLSGIGFFMVWAEVFAAHIGGGLYQVWMWLPIVFLPIGGVLAFFSLRNPHFKSPFRTACVIAIFLGGLGFVFHGDAFFEQLNKAQDAKDILRFFSFPPVLAPLSISLIGILGLLGIKESK